MPSRAVPVDPTARAGWASRWPALLAWGLWALTPLALPVVNWLDQRLRQAGLASWPSWNLPPSRWPRRR